MFEDRIDLYRKPVIPGAPPHATIPIPFNDETISALEEANRITDDPAVKKYANFAEILAEAKAELRNGIPDWLLNI